MDIPWRRKRQLSERMAKARDAKVQRLEDEHEGDPTETSSSDLDESINMPRVEIASDDECIESEKFVPGEFYREWVNCQTKYTIKILALLLMDTFRERFGLTDVAAATEAGKVVGYSERSIRTWHTEFYENEGEFEETLKGKHTRAHFLDDENCRKKALAWLHNRVYDKTQPAMTATIFANWVNSTLLPNTNLPPGFPECIAPRTARRWLHNLGFSPQPSKKGLYFDGHEREDVVEYRRIFLNKILALQSTHLPPPTCTSGQTEELIGNNEFEKRLVMIYHDESSFHANEGQTWQWAEEDKQMLRPKSHGRGLMISDFIEEHGGYLQLAEEEHEIAKISMPNIPKKAREIFKFGAQGDGYWNNELFIKQVKIAMSIAEFKYPKDQNTLLFLLIKALGTALMRMMH